MLPLTPTLELIIPIVTITHSMLPIKRRPLMDLEKGSTETDNVEEPDTETSSEGPDIESPIVEEQEPDAANGEEQSPETPGVDGEGKGPDDKEEISKEVAVAGGQSTEVVPTKEKELEEDTKVDEAVQFINDTAAKIAFQGCIEIGDYLLENFFNNDSKLASSKDPTKKTSFKKLCVHKDLKIHPSRLSLMVQTAVQERYLEENNVATDKLYYTHRTLLVKIEDSSDKISLIEECIENEWSTRRLDKEIKKLLGNLPESPPLSLLETSEKYIKKINLGLKKNIDSDWELEQSAITELNDDERIALKKSLNDLQGKAKESISQSKTITNKCKAVLKQLREIETGDHQKEDTPQQD
jgi:hypothetical protein